jgi:hypothetical protein
MLTLTLAGLALLYCVTADTLVLLHCVCVAYHYTALQKADRQMLLDGNDRERAFSSANTGLQGCGPWETLVAVHDQVCSHHHNTQHTVAQYSLCICVCLQVLCCGHACMHCHLLQACCKCVACARRVLLWQLPTAAVRIATATDTLPLLVVVVVVLSYAFTINCDNNNRAGSS